MSSLCGTHDADILLNVLRMFSIFCRKNAENLLARTLSEDDEGRTGTLDL
jgi:hypothetical protein